MCLEGDGPWDMEELKSLLKKCGLKPIGCGSRGAHKNEIVVVSRKADVNLIEEYINKREGDNVKLFPQELFVAALACGSDPFDLITDGDNDVAEVPEFLNAFGHGHPVIEYLKSLQFPWPTFFYEGGEPSTIPAVDDSPLIQLGYHVGVTKGVCNTR